MEKPQALTVSELNQKIKSILEPSFQDIWVTGEISNFKPSPSGHLYFSLKDEQSLVSVAIFGWSRHSASKNKIFKDGLKVQCHGKMSLYAPRGSYQIIVDHMEPLGVGSLQAEFEKLKNKLLQEGLFETSRKKPLPKFPKKIAIITSPTGAVIQDMLNILRRRAPHLSITIVPSLVQGTEAAEQLIRSLEKINQLNEHDLIVLARGGGSLEDLWCFNDEALARQIAKSALPVISAVGHEVDFTISDFVADLRAPTPSAAAEILSQYWVQAAEQMNEFNLRLKSAIQRLLQFKKQLFVHQSARLISPKDRLREQSQRCDDLSFRMLQAMKVLMNQNKVRLQNTESHLMALSPLGILDRGYSIVKTRDQKVIKTIQELKSEEFVMIQMKDGTRDAQIL